MAKKRIPYVVSADLVDNRKPVCSVTGKECKCGTGTGCADRKKKVKVY